MHADKKTILLVLSAFICVHLRFHPLLAGEPKFRAQTIDDKIQIGYGVAAADVDGDGKTDILLADKKQFVWYRNPKWEKFVIAENITKRDNVCLAAQDLDNDGKCELAVGADWDPNDRETSGAVFYLIAPADRTQKWDAVKLRAEPTVHRMKWMKLVEGGWGLVVAPLHGRGKDGGAGSRILLYCPPADPRAQWKTELVDDSMHATHNFDVTSTSLLIAGREGVLRVKREKDADGNVSLRKERLPQIGPTGEIRAGIMFVSTIEPMHGNSLAVYYGEPGQEKRKILTDQLTEGHALSVEYTLHGLMIVAGWRGAGGGITAYTPVNLDIETWQETRIDETGMACEDLCVADLNADGMREIIASGRSTHNVKIYWNETTELNRQVLQERQEK